VIFGYQKSIALLGQNNNEKVGIIVSELFPHEKTKSIDFIFILSPRFKCKTCQCPLPTSLFSDMFTNLPFPTAYSFV